MNRVLRICLGAVAGGCVVVLVLTFCNQLVVLVVDMVVCRPTAGTPSREFGEELPFDPKGVCWDTGVALTRGEEYDIHLEISEDWGDKSIKSDVTGWLDARWWMYGFTVWRRHLLAGWYEPMARIGGGGRDVYRLVAHDVGPNRDGSGRQERLVSRVKAGSSGRLYLYLNDAVVFGWGGLYGNNRGHAKVIVRFLRADGERRPR